VYANVILTGWVFHAKSMLVHMHVMVTVCAKKALVNVTICGVVKRANNVCTGARWTVIKMVIV
jgi:hypothetical protein